MACILSKKSAKGLVGLTFFLFFAAASSFPLQAKVWARISGSVKSEEGRPLAGAKVIFVFEEDGSTEEINTDEKGNWMKANLRSGTWTIGFMAEGYIPQNVKVKLSAIKDNEPIHMILARIPESPSKKGDELYREKHYAEALEEYKKLSEENPGIYEFYEKIGLCYYRLDDLDNAIDAFKIALEKEPQSQETLINLSALYFEKGLLEEGMAYFEKLNEESLTDPNVFFNAGILLFKNGEIDQAIRFFRRCLVLDPGYVNGYFQLALALLNKGDMEEAKMNFRKVIELDPESQTAATAKNILESINLNNS